MLDIAMFGWHWFAAAAALGAVTGYLTSSRERSAAVAPGWVLIALLLAIGVGVAASATDLLKGRMAVTLDIALAASVAYLVTLPIGRALKLLGAPQHETARVVTPTSSVVMKPVVERVQRPTPPVLEQEVVVAPENVLALDEIVVAAKVLGDKAFEMRARDKAAKQQRGQRPPTLAAPRGAADDLTRIKGLGPKSAERLHALGIFHYDQIAGWSRDNAGWVGAEIGVASRVERDDWVTQAQKLAGVSDEKSAASAA